jgi:hypothetical protein
MHILLKNEKFILIHLWKVSCWGIKVMRYNDIMPVSELIRHMSFCDTYRHAAGHHPAFLFYLMLVELSCISLYSKFCSDLVKCKTNSYLRQFKIATSVADLKVFIQHCNPLNISNNPHFNKNLNETCFRLVDYKSSLISFTKDNASVINVFFFFFFFLLSYN